MDEPMLNPNVYEVLAEVLRTQLGEEAEWGPRFAGEVGTAPWWISRSADGTIGLRDPDGNTWRLELVKVPSSELDTQG